MPVVSCAKTSLPRSLDVPVSLSRSVAETATDMTMMCFVTPGVAFPPGNDRVQFFSTFDAVQGAVPENSEAIFAAQAFFNRSDRPQTMCIGRVFTAPTNGALVSGSITLSNLANVQNGGFTISVGDTSYTVANLTFGLNPTMADVTRQLNAKMSAFANAVANADGKSVTITTNAIGDGADISYAGTPTESTDVSTLLNLTSATGASIAEGQASTSQQGADVTIGYSSSASSITDLSAILALTQSTAASRIDGYTPGGLVSEVALIQTAARCAGRSVFAWTLDRQYRDTQDQKDFADWAEAQDQAYFSACTNSVQAYNTADTTNIGFYAHNKGYIKTSVMYHNNPQVYPDVSYAALALSVNYALENSTLTMKFKQLTGIETVPLTETQLSSLKARRINTYVSMGNSSSVVREGVQSADSWFTDSHVNLSNYKEELQVEVFNVFMRNKKVKYTSAGQDLLVSAAAKINNRYIRNGTFADREEETTDNETGYTTLPACTITPAPIYSATTSERANRVAPPIAIVAYEAGAFHSVAIDVTVYN